MARFVLKTKTSGDIEFFVPDAGGYVRIESVDRTGVTGMQICQGGRLTGSTLQADAATLERVARRWRGQYLRRIGGEH